MQESGRQDQALRPPVLRLRAVRRRSGITEATYGWGGGNIFGDIFKWFAAAWGDSREWPTPLFLLLSKVARDVGPSATISEW